MQAKYTQVSLKQKKADVAVKISDKTDFKARKKLVEVHELKDKGHNSSGVLNA